MKSHSVAQAAVGDSRMCALVKELAVGRGKMDEVLRGWGLNKAQLAEQSF